MIKSIFIIITLLTLSCASNTNNTESYVEDGTNEIADGITLDTFKILDAKCQLKKQESCIQLGDKFTHAAELEKAHNYYSKACELGSNIGCYKLGIFLHNEDRLNEALIPIKKSCDGSNQWGCITLGRILDFQSKTKQANLIYEKHCKLNISQACVLRGINDETSGKYRSANRWYKKSCDLKGEAGCAYQSLTEFMIGNKKTAYKIGKNSCTNDGSKVCRVINLYDQLKTKPNILKIWKKNCRKNNNISCYNLGLHQSLNLKTLSAAKKTFRKACDLGNGAGCLELANFIHPYKELTKHRDLMIEACNKKSGPACNHLSRVSTPYKGTKTNEEYTIDACAYGDGRACASLGEQNKSSDIDEAKLFFRKACNLKTLNGCLRLSKLSEGPFEINVIDALCKKDHSDSCYELGIYYYKSKDYKTAIYYSDLACKNNNLAACQFAAQINSAINPKVEVNSKLKKYCNFGFNQSCLAAGKTLYSTGSVTTAKDYLNISCNRLDKDSCNYLGTIYEETNQMTEAISLYQKSCDLGLIQGCLNLK